MSLTRRNSPRIHAIDCRCRNCLAPARSPRDLAHRDRPHPFVFVFAGTMALWAVAAWVVWEFAR